MILMNVLAFYRTFKKNIEVTDNVMQIEMANFGISSNDVSSPNLGH
jgi:hypothetical protein